MLGNLIKRRFEIEIEKTTRAAKRDINRNIDEFKWLIAYPTKQNDTDLEYNEILLHFCNVEPVYFPAGNEYDIYDYTKSHRVSYYQDYADLACHMSGTIWISTKTIKKGYLEPIPTSLLDSAPELSVVPNTFFTDAIFGYMNLSDDTFTRDIENAIENYLTSLSPDIFKISEVFNDTDTSSKLPYGLTSNVIRYKNEVIGYLHRGGRELLCVEYFTNDMRRFQEVLKEMVDDCKIYDKMCFNGVKDISGCDADEFLAVPNFTTKLHEVNNE